MLPLLVALTLLLTAADHWTTYLCLRAPVAGWEVTEANPLADWLFAALGLRTALLLDTLVTLVAVAFLLSTPLVPRRAKAGFFVVIAAWTGWAVVNNVQAIAALGIHPLTGVAG
jgi:hypothetical protein